MNRLTEMILLSTHNIGFEGQISILEHAKSPLSRALQRTQPLGLITLFRCGYCLTLSNMQMHFDVYAVDH